MSHCLATNYHIFNTHSVSNYGAASYGSDGNDINAHQNFPSYGSFSSYGSAGDLHELNNGNDQHTFAQSVPISEHVEVTKPVAVPVVKNIGKM